MPRDRIIRYIPSERSCYGCREMMELLIRVGNGWVCSECLSKVLGRANTLQQQETADPLPGGRYAGGWGDEDLE